jgi:hypothetical protein
MNILQYTTSSANTLTRIFSRQMTGTASVTIATNTVAGAGTLFATEYRAGDDIIINNERKNIVSIQSNTTLTVESNYSATASTQNVFIFSQLLKGQNKIITLSGSSSNTADIFFGGSRNGTGTDVTATQNSVALQAYQPLGPIVSSDLYNVFALSSSANQSFAIIINQ